MIPDVVVHILDPADYVRRDGDDEVPIVDLLDLGRRLLDATQGSLDAWTLRRASGDVAFGLFSGETLVGLYPLPSARILCVVVPAAAPLTRAKIESRLAGAEISTVAPMTTAEDLYRFLLFHELAHCGETLHPARLTPRSEHSVYLAECRADAFAALMSGRRNDALHVARRIAVLRKSGARNRQDVEHHTAVVIEAAIASLESNPDLRSLAPDALLRIAREIVAAHAWDPGTYEARSQEFVN